MIQLLQPAAWCKRYLGRSEPDLYPVAAPHLFHVRYQPRGHVIQWPHFARAAQPDCFFGHGKDHAAGLILGNGQGAVLVSMPCPPSLPMSVSNTPVVLATHVRTTESNITSTAGLCRLTGSASESLHTRSAP